MGTNSPAIPEPGYKSNPFWGFVGVGIGLLLFSLGVLLPPVAVARWCLAGSWVCLTAAAFIFFNRARKRLLLTSGVSVIIGIVALLIALVFRGQATTAVPQNQDLAQNKAAVPSIQVQPEIKRRIPTLIKPHTQQSPERSGARPVPQPPRPAQPDPCQPAIKLDADAHDATFTNNVVIGASPCVIQNAGQRTYFGNNLFLPPAESAATVQADNTQIGSTDPTFRYASEIIISTKRVMVGVKIKIDFVSKIEKLAASISGQDVTSELDGEHLILSLNPNQVFSPNSPIVVRIWANSVVIISGGMIAHVP